MSKEKNKNLPVRKFLDNTFGRLLNDALYDLEYQRKKDPNNEFLNSIEGSLLHVANFLQNNLPKYEED